MTKTEKLFVYGSYCEGMVHFQRLQKFVSKIEPAQVRGSAYQLEVGYPIFMAEGEDIIEGEIITLEATETLFLLLDEFHGFSAQKPEKSLFFNIQIVAHKNQNESELVTAYAINPAKLPKTSKKIPNGQWRENLNEQQLITRQLTDKQMTYIRKLGNSSGRDIVPINLEMYRELMKLELIVDKGRRLALTKLGKEVFRYLPANEL